MPNPSPTTAHMRLSQFHLHTEKETPAEAEIASHRLMLKAGMLRRLAAGLYTWSPLGLRVLRKVEAIVREEMDRAGAIELLMPTRSEEHTSELQSLMRISYAVFCLKKKNTRTNRQNSYEDTNTTT